MIIFAVILFMYSGSDRALLCGRWSMTQTQNQPWTNNRVVLEEVMNFSLFGNVRLTLYVDGEENQTSNGRYSLKNGRITVKAEDQIKQSSYTIIDDKLSVDGYTYTKTSSENVSVSACLKIFSILLTVIGVIMLMGKKNDKKNIILDEIVESESDRFKTAGDL